LNIKETQTIECVIKAISTIIKGEMPQQLDLIEHDSHKVTELVSTTNRLIKSFNEANDFISSLAQGKLNIDIPGRNYLASKELYLKFVFKGKGGVSTGRLLAAVNRPH